MVHPMSSWKKVFMTWVCYSCLVIISNCSSLCGLFEGGLLCCLCITLSLCSAQPQGFSPRLEGHSSRYWANSHLYAFLIRGPTTHMHGNKTQVTTCLRKSPLGGLVTLFFNSKQLSPSILLYSCNIANYIDLHLSITIFLHSYTNLFMMHAVLYTFIFIC